MFFEKLFKRAAPYWDVVALRDNVLHLNGENPSLIFYDPQIQNGN